MDEFLFLKDLLGGKKMKEAIGRATFRVPAFFRRRGGFRRDFTPASGIVSRAGIDRLSHAVDGESTWDHGRSRPQMQVKGETSVA